MRYIWQGMGFALAFGLLVVSGSMNWQFGFSLGESQLAQYTYGGASVLADAFKALIPIFFLYAIVKREWLRAAASLVVGVICVGYSFTSAIGFSAQNRDTQTSTRLSASDMRRSLADNLKHTRQKQRWIPEHRPAGTVQALMEKSKTNYRWASTTKCTNATSTKSRTFCADHAKLKSELASAVAGAKLDKKIATLITQIAALPVTASSKSADLPQVAVLSKLLSVDTSKVDTALVVLLALLVEVGSAFGFLIVFGTPGAPSGRVDPRTKKSPPWHEEEDDKDTTLEEPVRPHLVVDNAQAKAEQIEASLMVGDSDIPMTPYGKTDKNVIDQLLRARQIHDFVMANCSVTGEEDQSIGATALYNAYLKWAKDHEGKELMSQSRFGELLMDELRSQIWREKRKVVYYFGITLEEGSLEVSHETSVSRAA